MSGTEELLSGVVFGNGLFVAVGLEGAIVSSPDGVSWTVESSGSTASFRAVAFASGLFVVVGTGGTILTSPDGHEWTPRSLGTAAVLSGVAFGNGRFVAVGLSGAVVYSADAISWSPASSLTSNFLQSVTFGGGKFVAVGGSGTVRTSTDGVTWARSTTGLPQFLSGAAYFDGKYYVVGNSGIILSSPDTLAWTHQGTFDTWFRAVGSDGSQVVVAGDDGTVVTSRDGVDWTPQTTGVTRSLNSITFGNGLFVAVGEPDGVPQNGLILTAPSTAPPDPDSDDDDLLDTWEIDHFGDLATSSGGDDPEGDGLANVIESLLDLDPNASDAGSPRLPRFENASGTAIVWTQHSERAASADVSVAYSETLALGSWSILNATVEVLYTDGDLETVRVIDPDAMGTMGRRFYQLRFGSP